MASVLSISFIWSIYSWVKPTSNKCSKPLNNKQQLLKQPRPLNSNNSKSKHNRALKKALVLKNNPA